MKNGRGGIWLPPFHFKPPVYQMLNEKGFDNVEQLNNQNVNENEISQQQLSELLQIRRDKLSELQGKERPFSHHKMGQNSPCR